jgi:putative pyrroloquinoline-quinone-binding quinoprotein
MKTTVAPHGYRTTALNAVRTTVAAAAVTERRMVAPQIRSQLLYKSIAPVVLVFMALTSASATDQWPQFRGLQAGVAADDPALPDRWTPTENIVWKIDVPGIGWSSPVVWDDHIFVTSVISEGEVEPPKPGLFYAGERPTSTDVHRWMVYDIEFATGRIRWQREVRRAAPRLRVLRQRWPVCFRPEWETHLVERFGKSQHTRGLGDGRFTSSSSRTSVCPERQQHSVVHRRL